MKIYNITDKEFKEYGKVIDYNFSSLIEKLKSTPRPDDKCIYVASSDSLECDKSFSYVRDYLYGGMPIQFGYCNGFNRKLNCLEYHKDNEINVTEDDMVLLLAKESEIENNTLSTTKVKAFLVPKGSAVEIYSSTLHYAPIGFNKKPFRVVIILPLGTNTEKPKDVSDKLLRAKNKWLIAHKDSAEAKNGAVIGLIGENIEL